MTRRLLAVGGLALVLVGAPVAYAATTASTATCTPSPEITTGTADQSFSVTCSVPLPDPVTSTVTETAAPTSTVTVTDTSTVTSTVTQTVTATPTTTTTTATPAPTTTTTAAPTGWTLTWADEFNGTTVDTTKWNVRDGDYLDYDLACIWSRNATVANGILSLTSKRESSSCFGGGTRAYTTAYLDTKTKASWAYGRFEMRAKVPLPKNASKGIWPAFWLRPDDGGDGELDITEQYGTGTNGSGGDGHEFGETHATVWKSYSPSVHEGNDYQSGVDLSADFHTYAMEWEPGVARFYLDGVLNYTRSTSTTSWWAGVYDKGRKFNIRLNQQVGGSWAGTPDTGSTFPAAFQIDYVRVYQR